MAGLTPTQRTLRAQKELGRICAITEKWNPHVGPCGIRQDLFGFIDVISLAPERGIVAIQATGTAYSQHLTKLLVERATECIEWLKCGGKIELWGWRKVKLKRGGKAKVWKPRIREITLEDY